MAGGWTAADYARDAEAQTAEWNASRSAEARAEQAEFWDDIDWPSAYERDVDLPTLTPEQLADLGEPPF